MHCWQACWHLATIASNFLRQVPEPPHAVVEQKSMHIKSLQLHAAAQLFSAFRCALAPNVVTARAAIITDASIKPDLIAINHLSLNMRDGIYPAH
jgi:hypothetical protein